MTTMKKEDTRSLLTPVVAIVGRTNVGKSTMFNRLLERRKAITSDKEGTTRDLNFGHFGWRGLTITAIDTAGLDLTSAGATEEALKQQAELALTKADIVLMLVDAEAGLMPQDRALAKYLLQAQLDKPILLAVNKADNPRVRRSAAKVDWAKLGLGGQPTLCSAANGSGVGDLLDQVVDLIKERGLDAQPLPEPDLKLALIGRPNAGKSSLLNALAGERRVIVSEIPHTTKEPQDTMLRYLTDDGQEKNLLIIDTVGIRRQSRVTSGLEYIGVGKSFSEMRQADIGLLMIDAAEGINAQDKKLTGLIEKSRVGVIVLANKWDLAEEQRLGDAEAFRQHLTETLPFCRWAPLLFVSALTGRGVDRILPACLRIMKERRKQLDPATLTAFQEKLKKVHGSFFRSGPGRPHVYGISQVGIEPPTFEVVVRKKETVHVNFLRFIENRLRDEFGFEGTPIRVRAREITKSKRL